MNYLRSTIDSRQVYRNRQCRFGPPSWNEANLDHNLRSKPQHCQRLPSPTERDAYPRLAGRQKLATRCVLPRLFAATG